MNANMDVCSVLLFPSREFHLWGAEMGISITLGYLRLVSLSLSALSNASLPVISLNERGIRAIIKL